MSNYRDRYRTRNSLKWKRLPNHKISGKITKNHQERQISDTVTKFSIYGKGTQPVFQHQFTEKQMWQLLSIKENICPERPRKSHALQDGKKYFFLYTTRKMRSTAFQPCITLGGLHWDEMGQKHDFLKKNALKTAFLGDTILDRLTSEGVGSPKKIKNATFLMLSFNDGP